MANNPNKLFKFWQELKRRKVVAVIIVYATTAFILMQLAQVLEGSLNLPQWFDTMITIALIIGFPIAIIFSWVFDVSSKGITKTESENNSKITPKESIKDTPERSIIVLPFENISSDSEQEYFSDGLTEEIITDLSYIHNLLVISRSSAMTFKGSKYTIKKIAEKVNVKYVLEGSVRKSENNLRIVAQLIDAQTDTHLWAEKYTGTLDDIFDIQEKVSLSIANAMRLKISQKVDEKIKEHPINNTLAYELHLRAKYELNLNTEESIKRGIDLTKKGLDIIGDNELLYADLGRGYLLIYEYISKEDKVYLDKTENCIKHIFDLNPYSSVGHSLEGELQLRKGQVKNSISEFKKALKIDPYDNVSLFRLGYLSFLLGNSNLGISMLRKLCEIDPLTPIYHMVLGVIKVFEGNFDDGLKLLEKAHKMEPKNPQFLFMNAMGHAWKGNKSNALKLFHKNEKEIDASIFTMLSKVFIYALKGMRKEMLQSVTENLIDLAKEDEMYPIWMAECYSLINEHKNAIDWLEQGVNYGFFHYPWLSKDDPLLENIRSKSRFKTLLERVKKERENFEV